MEDILLINALETISGVSAKDCIELNGLVTYFVKDSEVGKAIGKKAVNIKNLEGKIKKRVEIISYNAKPEDVLKKTFEVEIEKAEKKGKRFVVVINAQQKGKVFSNMSRFKRVKELISRNYDLDLIVH